MKTKTAPPQEKDFQTRTNEYAAHCIASMRDDLDALNHAQECNGRDDSGEECKRGSETKTFRYGRGKNIRAEIRGKVGHQNIHENPEAWHDEDKARVAIEEGHYGIQVRGGWRSPGESESEAEEYVVTLGGGGPASRITGDLDRGQPTTAVFEFQDWFKPWTAAQTTEEQDTTMLEWVSILYFGE